MGIRDWATCRTAMYIPSAPAEQTKASSHYAERWSEYGRRCADADSLLFDCIIGADSCVGTGELAQLFPLKVQDRTLTAEAALGIFAIANASNRRKNKYEVVAFIPFLLLLHWLSVDSF
jgi:hypothetical protein